MEASIVNPIVSGEPTMEIVSEILVDASPWIEQWLQQSTFTNGIEGKIVNSIVQVWYSSSTPQSSQLNEMQVTIFAPQEASDPPGKFKLTYDQSEIRSASKDQLICSPSIFTRFFLESEISLGFLNILSSLAYRIKYQIFIQAGEFFIIRKDFLLKISLERHYRDPNLHMEWHPRKVYFIASICCTRENHSVAAKTLVELCEEFLKFKSKFDKS